MRLGLTLIFVEDFPLMLGFYRDVLGLEVTDTDPGPGHEPGVDWAQLRGEGGGEIELFDHAVFARSRDYPLPRKNSLVLTFRVDDVDAKVEELRRHGVEVPHVARQSWGAAAHFFDPEGNELQVFETA